MFIDDRMGMERESFPGIHHRTGEMFHLVHVHGVDVTGGDIGGEFSRSKVFVHDVLYNLVGLLFCQPDTVHLFPDKLQGNRSFCQPDLY